MNSLGNVQLVVKISLKKIFSKFIVIHNLIIVDKSTAPQNKPGTSIPGLVNLLQNDYDGLVLEIHNLKQNLNSTRQELSQALYQHEAACRVIARLLKELKETKEDLAKLKELTRENIEINKGIDENLKIKFNEFSESLSNSRKSRKPPADLVREDGLSKFKEVLTESVHNGFITSIQVSRFNPQVILTGGKDSTSHIYDIEKKTSLTTIDCDKKVTSAVFINDSSLNLITCLSDGNAKVWEVSPDYNAKALYTISEHKKNITSCSIHPCNDYCLFFSKDGYWSLYDLLNKKLVQSISAKDKLSIHCGEIHPDGLIVGTGHENGVVMWWDIRTQQPHNTQKFHKGHVKVLNFSEKAYQMITVGKNETGVRFWDIRKLDNEEPVSIISEKSSQVRKAYFDQYGMYFGMCGNVVDIYKARGANKIAEIGEGDFTDLKFGQKNEWIVAGTTEGMIKIFK